MLAMRLFVGLFLASAMGVAPYIASSILAPPGTLRALAVILVVGSGAGASVGTALSWAAMQESGRIVRTVVLLAVPAAFLGAWGGYSYGLAVYGHRVVPKPDTVLSTVLGAAVAANLLLALACVVWSFTRKRS